MRDPNWIDRLRHRHLYANLDCSQRGRGYIASLAREALDAHHRRYSLATMSD
jgi:hypothetical protein